ncbi:hypothetical protein a10_09538 [Streptomyces acidiscabies]|nr:hypothetical protein a10_09538 [Streptomyces acidiscabies]GAV46405.1 hypothetical protein Saa2_09412 [Streptomyces acidiscabies]
MRRRRTTVRREPLVPRPWTKAFRAGSRDWVTYANAPSRAPGVTSWVSSQGVVNRSRTTGSSPPIASAMTRVTLQRASARDARNSASMRRAVLCSTSRSAPAAVMSLSPGQTVPRCAAKASSARRYASWRRARGRRVRAKRATPAARGGRTTISRAGAREKRPTRAPTDVNTKERETMTSPAKVSRAISTCWVSPERAPRSASRTPRRTTPVTSRSRRGSTRSATHLYTRPVPTVPAITPAPATPSHPIPTPTRPARNPSSRALANAYPSRKVWPASRRDQRVRRRRTVRWERR